MSLFDLYKNGAFVSSFNTLDEAEQAGKFIMRDRNLRNVYLSVYPKSTNGKGQPVLEQMRGTGVEQRFDARSAHRPAQAQQGKPDNFSTLPWFLQKPPETPPAELPWFMQKPPANWCSRHEKP